VLKQKSFAVATGLLIN